MTLEEYREALRQLGVSGGLPSIPRPSLPYELGGPAKHVIGRNPRTGRAYYEEPTPAIFDAPAEIAGGLDTLLGHDRPAPTLSGDDERSSGERAGGASKALRGAMTLATPLVPGAIAAAPIGAAAGLVGGALTQEGVEQYLNRVRGVDPGWSALGGDVAGILAGGALGAVPEAQWRALPGQLLTDERGAITIGPGPEWRSTLADLIEKKAPKVVEQKQLRNIMAEAPAEEVKYSPLTKTLDQLQRIRDYAPVTKADVMREANKPPVRLEEKLYTEGDVRYGPEETDWAEPGGENYRELLIRTPDISPEQPYKHAHWPGEVNVIGHMRMDDRVTPEGKPVLFVQEWQSDIHQAGRKKPYKSGRDWQAEMEALRAQWDAAQQQRNNWWEANRNRFADLQEFIRRSGPETPHQELAAARAERNDLQEMYNDVSLGVDKHQAEINLLEREWERERALNALPDLPFKKDAWQELLFKRSLQEAVDRGQHGVAWTSGEMQAKRYNMRNHVEEIFYNPEEHELWANDRRGNEVIRERVKPDELDRYVGRALADELRKQSEGWEPPPPPKRYTVDRDYEAQNHNQGVRDGDIDGEEMGQWIITDENAEPVLDSEGEVLRFEDRYDALEHRDYYLDEGEHESPDYPSVFGEDLAIGGHGHEGFYDVIMRKYADKYGKKWGAKTSEIELPGLETPVPYLEITEPMYWSIKEQGQPLFGNKEPAPRPKPQRGFGFFGGGR